MSHPGIYSEVTFSGVFNNVYIIERMYHGSILVHENRKCMSKENAATYLVNRGYYTIKVGKLKQVAEKLGFVRRFESDNAGPNQDKGRLNSFRRPLFVCAYTGLPFREKV